MRDICRRRNYGKNYCNCEPEGWRRKNNNRSKSGSVHCRKGLKVLAVDMDPQGNMTTGLGVNKDDLEYTIYDVMRDECNIGECMLINVIPGLNLIPSNRLLAGVEVEFVGVPNMQYILKENLNKIRDKFDFIIIDCPPALGLLTVNSMTAADTVLVPIQCEFFALDGLSQLIYTIELIQKQLNTNLKIEGVVFTMYDSRTNLSLQVVENVKDNLKQNIYKPSFQETCVWQRLQAMVCRSICMIHGLRVQRAIVY